MMNKTKAKPFKLYQLALLLFLVIGSLSSVWAQAPTEATASPTPASSPTPGALPTAGTTLPAEENFDIDLDTSEFEDFGEENFQVEEELSPTAEASISAIKIIAVVLGILFGIFLISKLLQSKK